MGLSFCKEGPYSSLTPPGPGAKEITLDFYGTLACVAVNTELTERKVKVAFGYFIRDERGDEGGVPRPDRGLGHDIPGPADAKFAFFEVPNVRSAGRAAPKAILRYPTGEYFESSEPDGLWPLLMGTVTQHVCRHQSKLCFIHSASLCMGERGIVLVGGSGSGKTTLALALSQNGCGFLSDEFGAIDLDSHLLLPFPRAVLPRQSTMRLLGLATDGCEFFDEADQRRYVLDPLDPRHGITIGRPVPILLVVFIEPTRGEASLTQFGRAKALEMMAQGSINASQLPKEMRLAMLKLLYEVLKGANCCMLRASSIPQSVRQVLDAVQSSDAGHCDPDGDDLEKVYLDARDKLERIVRQR